jgi:hypothetical protein
MQEPDASEQRIRERAYRIFATNILTALDSWPATAEHFAPCREIMLAVEQYQGTELKNQLRADV